MFGACAGDGSHSRRACRACNRAYSNRYYHNESTEQRAKRLEYSRNYLRERGRAYKIKLLERFGGACVDCGYAGHPAALEFDHVDPTVKEFEIGKGLTGKSWGALVAEASKCVIRCSNCHRIRTYLEGQSSIGRRKVARHLQRSGGEGAGADDSSARVAAGYTTESPGTLRRSARDRRSDDVSALSGAGV